MYVYVCIYVCIYVYVYMYIEGSSTGGRGDIISALIRTANVHNASRSSSSNSSSGSSSEQK
jgi:hypothetical protein